MTTLGQVLQRPRSEDYLSPDSQTYQTLEDALNQAYDAATPAQLTPEQQQAQHEQRMRTSPAYAVAHSQDFSNYQPIDPAWNGYLEQNPEMRPLFGQGGAVWNYSNQNVQQDETGRYRLAPVDYNPYSDAQYRSMLEYAKNNQIKMPAEALIGYHPDISTMSWQDPDGDGTWEWEYSYSDTHDKATKDAQVRYIQEWSYQPPAPEPPPVVYEPPPVTYDPPQEYYEPTPTDDSSMSMKCRLGLCDEFGVSGRGGGWASNHNTLASWSNFPQGRNLLAQRLEMQERAEFAKNYNAYNQAVDIGNAQAYMRSPEYIEQYKQGIISGLSVPEAHARAVEWTGEYYGPLGSSTMQRLVMPQALSGVQTHHDALNAAWIANGATGMIQANPTLLKYNVPHLGAVRVGNDGSMQLGVAGAFEPNGQETTVLGGQIHADMTPYAPALVSMPLGTQGLAMAGSAINSQIDAHRKAIANHNFNIAKEQADQAYKIGQLQQGLVNTQVGIMNGINKAQYQLAKDQQDYQLKAIEQQGRQQQANKEQLYFAPDSSLVQGWRSVLKDPPPMANTVFDATGLLTDRYIKSWVDPKQGAIISKYNDAIKLDHNDASLYDFNPANQHRFYNAYGLVKNAIDVHHALVNRYNSMGTLTPQDRAVLNSATYNYAKLQLMLHQFHQQASKHGIKLQ